MKQRFAMHATPQLPTLNRQATVQATVEGWILYTVRQPGDCMAEVPSSRYSNGRCSSNTWA